MTSKGYEEIRNEDRKSLYKQLPFRNSSMGSFKNVTQRSWIEHRYMAFLVVL